MGTKVIIGMRLTIGKTLLESCIDGKRSIVGKNRSCPQAVKQPESNQKRRCKAGFAKHNINPFRYTHNYT